MLIDWFRSSLVLSIFLLWLLWPWSQLWLNQQTRTGIGTPPSRDG